MLRNLGSDIKEFPATMVLCALWIVVFGVMVARDWAAGNLHGFNQLLFGTIGGGHRIGDMTVAELFRGEIWRAVTSTFVHYNVLHIGMNLYGMYLLGCLVESWYGPWLFVAVYAATGGLGNLLSGLIRRMLGTEPTIHSGGGSTVVLGLVALCAVVGWRSKSRIGDYLRGQMVGVLVFTALLGLISPMIDNWGHAGGAAVGAAIGFAHRRLIRSAHQSIARWAGVLGALILVVSGAAQVREDRREDRLIHLFQSSYARAEEASRAWLGLLGVREFYHQAALRSHDPLSFLVPGAEVFRRAQKANLAILDAVRDRFGNNETAEDFRRARALIDRVFARPPTSQEQYEFLTCMAALMNRVVAEQKVAGEQCEALRLRLGWIPTTPVRKAPPVVPKKPKP